MGGGSHRLARTQTLNAIRRRHTERRATMRRSRREDVIPEDPREFEEIEDVSHRLAHAPQKVTFDDDGGGGGDGGDGGGGDREEEKRHQSVKRTETYQDPEGLEEREI